MFRRVLLMNCIFMIFERKADRGIVYLAILKKTKATTNIENIGGDEGDRLRHDYRTLIKIIVKLF